jgi:hypothetical protein
VADDHAVPEVDADLAVAVHRPAMALAVLDPPPCSPMLAALELAVINSPYTPR